jgi:hypothetical protein
LIFVGVSRHPGFLHGPNFCSHTADVSRCLWWKIFVRIEASLGTTTYVVIYLPYLLLRRRILRNYLLDWHPRHHGPGEAAADQKSRWTGLHVPKNL